MNRAIRQSAAFLLPSKIIIINHTKTVRFTMLNNVNNQLLAEHKTFEAFAFLYHTRFCLQPVENRNNILKMYDTFDYAENDKNMPFEGKLITNKIHIVTVTADKKDNYTISNSLRTFFINDLNRRIGQGEIKDILSECYDEYFEQRYKDSLKRFEQYFPF